MSSSVITKLKSYAGLINDILNDNQINIQNLSQSPVQNLQQVLSVGNSTKGLNIDASGGSIISSNIITNTIQPLSSNINISGDIIFDMSKNINFSNLISIKEANIQRIYTDNGNIVLDPSSNLKLNKLSNSTASNILYYNDTTKVVSYGTNTIAGFSLINDWSSNGKLYPTLVDGSGNNKPIYNNSYLYYVNDDNTLYCNNFKGESLKSNATNSNITIEGLGTGDVILKSNNTNVLTVKDTNEIDIAGNTNISSTKAINFLGDISIKQGSVNKIYTTSSGSVLNIDVSTVQLNNISSSAQTNILYINPITKELSYSYGLFDCSPKNILSMTSRTYTTNFSDLSCGVGSDITTYGNYIQAILKKGTYNLNQGLICGSTLDLSNNRFNITTSGFYLLSLSVGVISLGSTGNLISHIFVNNSQYSNSPTNTIFWGAYGMSNISAISPSSINVSNFTLQLNNGDYIDIRARQTSGTITTGYQIFNGATISLERIK